MNDLVVIWYESVSFLYHSTERDYPKYITHDSRTLTKKCTQNEKTCWKLHYVCSDSSTIYSPQTFEVAREHCAKVSLPDRFYNLIYIEICVL